MLDFLHELLTRLIFACSLISASLAGCCVLDDSDVAFIVMMHFSVVDLDL